MLQTFCPQKNTTLPCFYLNTQNYKGNLIDLILQKARGKNFQPIKKNLK